MSVNANTRRTRRIPSGLIVAAAIYVAFLWPLVAAVSRMERRFAARRR